MELARTHSNRYATTESASVTGLYSNDLASVCDLGIIVVNADRRIALWNPWMERVSGIPETSAAGNSLVDLYPELEGSRILKAIDVALDTGLTTVLSHSLNRNLLPLTKAGKKNVRLEHSLMIRSFSAETLGSCCLVQVTDVSNAVSREELLKRAKEEAVAASKAKSEFLANMSHELRTPLNAVLGFAQMLLLDTQTPLSQAQSEKVESISEGGKHLLLLVNEVLDLAKIEADQLELSSERFAANDVVTECVDMSAPLGKELRVKVENLIEDEPLIPLRTDQMRFKQVLINLLSNAVKFNKDGGTVTVNGEAIGDGYFRFSVMDTGIGIADEDRSSVFHKFHRVGSDPELAREGTGIGLTVSKLLVERMSGHIGFESELGVGTTFWFELPLDSDPG